MLLDKREKKISASLKSIFFGGWFVYDLSIHLGIPNQKIFLSDKKCFCFALWFFFFLLVVCCKLMLGSIIYQIIFHLLDKSFVVKFLLSSLVAMNHGLPR